ncbi:MFS transporter, DHA2 family, metal-tetracycline-proton antiporter/MFS transporter, DHA2 family, florfenicol/chloramphenicol resistance protein [Pseudonocardia ammonioxydans]|uniref:MFS transporter, DHA2 family, metal-tetracycline-proton antiporter/MFS transporter, DHA2 family, florfenicol/chloramphenicol resistance protein n=1 Tax=Pseudonocardia ammonioxydans TaxID=260086 RepID=A0A1I5DXK1_PSUAM|nr:MFS transporter [Pseudonocardia ammonioxydans]SFO03949.1 MFS transporter, DHA2 family, metal-tetracycline-proton antiporter/MFS transporter, DHA2 family, florfenicol/chloramphenicol resistance protein [Pseudonocardia ammonioxydans]
MSVHGDHEPPPEAPATARVGVLLAVLVTAVTVTVINNSMVIVLLPDIQRDFAASAAAASWVVTGFSLAFAVGTPLYGRVSDVFGIRWVFCAGLAVFAAGSALAALSGGLPMLLVARVLQGIGGSAVPALASVTVARVLPPGRRGLAFGLIGTGVGVGQALGPVLGGLVAFLAGWPAPFLGAALLTVPILVLAARMLPGRDAAVHGGWRDLDLPGGVLLGAAAALALFGVTQGERAGFGSPAPWGSCLLAAAFAVGFTVRIRTARVPFAPPSLFRNRRFVTTAVVGFLTLFCYLGVVLLIPQLVGTVNGLDPARVGLVLMPGAVAVALLSALFGRLSDRIGTRLPVVGGLSVLLVTVVVLSTVAGGSAIVIGAVTFLLGLALAMITAPLINEVSAVVGERDAGVGLGIYQGAFFLGGGTGAAVIGAVLSARADTAAVGWNPWHDIGEATMYSDALLVIAAVVVPAIGVASGLSRRRVRSGAPAP